MESIQCGERSKAGVPSITLTVYISLIRQLGTNFGMNYPYMSVCGLNSSHPPLATHVGQAVI